MKLKVSRILSRISHIMRIMYGNLCRIGVQFLMIEILLITGIDYIARKQYRIMSQKFTRQFAWRNYE